MTLRSILRRIAEKLRPGSRESLEAARLGMLVRAVARNARRASDNEVPPAAAMMEVLLREVQTSEVEAAIEQLKEQDGAAVMALLARMREEQPTPAPSSPEEAPAETIEEPLQQPPPADLESIQIGRASWR